MSNSVRDLILRHMPRDGSAIGNIKLMEIIRKEADRQGLPFDEADYQATRDALVAEGRLAKGRGRGGSVYRPDGQAGSASESSRPGPSAAAGGEGTPEVGPDGQYGSYRHPDPAVLRPDVGVQDQFPARRKPKQYRYDSSLAPELAWDENAGREFAEWLLELVSRAAEQGEAKVFAEPQVWKGTGEAFHSTSQCAARLKSLTRPFLNWAGKAERHEISVPTVPLFVHERHSTRAILERLQSYKAAGQNMELFGDPQVDIADRLDAYEHTGPWTNRMILGDSLQVMNSLLEYEGLGGQVQMIYIDPPYGVKFGSNFQPFVRKRNVKHGKDEEMVREPEMVKAYRDTWELGLHSYLSYLRDRLYVFRELIAESGSVFIQISDENIHHVREVLDEVFGERNFCAVIVFQKTSGQSSPTGATDVLASVSDFLLWYCKDIEKIKYNRLYLPKAEKTVDEQYSWLEELDGTCRKLTRSEVLGAEPLPAGQRFMPGDATSRTGGQSTTFEIDIGGSRLRPSGGRGWLTHEKGMKNLAAAGRLLKIGKSLRAKRYLDDFPYSPLSNSWSDTGISGFGSERLYVVQTSTKVVDRCLLIPGNSRLDAAAARRLKGST